MAWFRLLVAFLLLEALGLARGIAAIRPFLPDVVVAASVAIALAGKSRVVLSAALGLCLLRAPTTLDDPLASSAAILGFSMFLLETRRFYARDRAPIVFAAGALGFLATALAAGAANAARGEPSPGLGADLAPAVATGLAAAALVPALRSSRLTKRLLERRFGE